MSPFFSVVIPTYNRAHLLKPTLDSVLNQDFPDFEIVIIDDGSKDNTAQFIQETYGNQAKVQYYYKNNGERGAARNYGLAQAKGQYVIFLDSDDLFRENHLSSLYAILKQNPGVNFFAAKYDFDRNGRLTPSDLKYLPAGLYDLDIVLVGNPFSCNFGVKKDNPALIKFREEREFVIIEDWVFLVENLFRDKIYLTDANTSVLVDHDDRSMRADQSNIINKRIFALNWLLQKYPFSPAQKKKISGYSYYFCAVHAYIDGNQKQGLGFLRKAIADLGLTKRVVLLAAKLLVGRKIFSSVFNRK